MRISDILSMIKMNFLLGLVVVLVLYTIMCIGYFFVYKKMLGGSKKFNKKKTIIWAVFIGYLIVVIDVTFLNRGPGIYENSANFYFLSTYRGAWNTLNYRSWQLIILNMLLFVPLGIFLPIIHNKFYNIFMTLVLGFMITLIIESTQLLTGFGVFDIDDIFNNTLGTAVGYSLSMSAIEILHKRKNRKLNILMYLSPAIVVASIFIGNFTYYNLKEFGNLTVNYNYRVDMKDAEVSTDLEFSAERINVPIYKAPTYTKQTAKEFAMDFLKNINIDVENLEIIDYSDASVYWVRGEPSYNIWLDYLDGSYRYTVFSGSDEKIEQVNMEENTLIENLSRFNIDVPENAVYSSVDTGTYQWMVDMEIKDDYLVDGFLSCTYCSDIGIKNVTNNLIVYKKIKDAEVISEAEAYKKLIDGKFKRSNLSSTIKTINITKVVMDYSLDSKGFLQPVYIFYSLINDKETAIVIPAL
nr:VanZ family protein [Sedimentibacter sp.]